MRPRPAATRLAAISLGLGLALCTGGCGGGDDGASSGAKRRRGGEIGGSYQVTGVTIDQQDGTQRPISGTLNLEVEGDTYTSHFELSTLFPGSDAAAARVVGTGEGRISGSELEGDAELQLLLATAPNVDVGFAYVPREVGPRVLSKAKAHFFEDGSVRIEIENQPAENEDYSPTRTLLVGYKPDA